MQSDFVDPIAALGPPSHVRQVPQATIAAYHGRLPQGLLEFWERVGWCSFLDGYVWICDPSDLVPVFASALSGDLEFQARDFVPYSYKAFGRIEAWNFDTKIATLDVAQPSPAFQIQTRDRLFDHSTGEYWSDDKALSHSIALLARAREQFAKLGTEDFFPALQKLGPLDPLEMYGYVPATALGGNGTVDTIKKVKIIEHLLIILAATEVSYEKYVFDADEISTYPVGRMQFVRYLGSASK